MKYLITLIIVCNHDLFESYTMICIVRANNLTRLPYYSLCVKLCTGKCTRFFIMSNHEMKDVLLSPLSLGIETAGGEKTTADRTPAELPHPDQGIADLHDFR